MLNIQPTPWTLRTFSRLDIEGPLLQTEDPLTTELTYLQK